MKSSSQSLLLLLLIPLLLISPTPVGAVGAAKTPKSAKVAKSAKQSKAPKAPKHSKASKVSKEEKPSTLVITAEATVEAPSSPPVYLKTIGMKSAKTAKEAKSSKSSKAAKETKSSAHTVHEHSVLESKSAKSKKTAKSTKTASDHDHTHEHSLVEAKAAKSVHEHSTLQSKSAKSAKSKTAKSTKTAKSDHDHVAKTAKTAKSDHDHKTKKGSKKSKSSSASTIVDECVICSKSNKVAFTTLTIQYNAAGKDENNQGSKAYGDLTGVFPPSATITASNSNFQQTVSDGEIFTLPAGSKNKFPAELELFLDGGSSGMVGFHTSCSVDLTVGDSFGPFLVLGTNEVNQDCAPPPTPPTPPPPPPCGGGAKCPKCLICSKKDKAKFTKLTIQYNSLGQSKHNQGKKKAYGDLNGIFPQSVKITTKHSKFKQIVSDGEIFELPSGGKGKGFPAALELFLDGGNSGMVGFHTSCSVDLNVHDQFGPFTILGTAEVDQECKCTDPEPPCPTPPPPTPPPTPQPVITTVTPPPTIRTTTPTPVTTRSKPRTTSSRKTTRKPKRTKKTTTPSTKTMPTTTFPSTTTTTSSSTSTSTSTTCAPTYDCTCNVECGAATWTTAFSDSQNVAMPDNVAEWIKDFHILNRPITTTSTSTSTSTSTELRSGRSCEDLGWSTTGSVCSDSVVDASGQCYAETVGTTVTHSDAEEICEAEGSRLCTADELSTDVAKGTGCAELDAQMIWTSETCAEGSGFFVASGSATGVMPVCNPNLPSHPDLFKFGVRCCADSDTFVPPPSTDRVAAPGSGDDDDLVGSGTTQGVDDGSRSRRNTAAGSSSSSSSSTTTTNAFVIGGAGLALLVVGVLGAAVGSAYTKRTSTTEQV